MFRDNTQQAKLRSTYLPLAGFSTERGKVTGQTEPLTYTDEAGEAIESMNTREIENAVAVAAVRAACTTGQARRIRKGANLSLQMVARAIGVSHSTVMRWEGATHLPTGPRALGYSRLLARLNGGAL